jgi:hypothetical protein
MSFGNRFYTDITAKGGQYYQIGRVKSIILSPNDEGYENPSDIGKITYSLLYSPLNTSFAGLVNKPAYPMWGFMKQFPVLNEIVLIFTGPTPGLNDYSQNQQSFYFPPYNLWNDSEQNAFPDLNELAQFRNNLAQVQGYVSDGSSREDFPLGKTFRLRQVDNIRSLQPFEGDTILQARFGQSIRFGSTNILPQTPNSRQNARVLNNWSVPQTEDPNSTNGDPITIILNEQGVRPESAKFDTLIEDIEKDGSSIYMTSTQVLDLSFAKSFPLTSFTSTEDISTNLSSNGIKNTTSTKSTSAANQDIRSNR